MKIRNILLAFSILIISFSNILAQLPSQTIKGTVVDIESQTTLPGAAVQILNSDPLRGTTTDFDGFFKLENVSVGRHDLLISFVGYEDVILSNLAVTSGKELVLQIEMKEALTEIDEIVVSGNNQKDQPLNSMASISARSFSVEETRRYAGGIDDPARMASSFAGVNSSTNVGDNRIVVRGNSPKGILWKLDGVAIPNPNHFGQIGGTGGGVTVFSGQMLSNSDFFTGAFPAEYGNALAAVFDMNLRIGNNEKREHAVQIGVQGIDISSEGPFSKNGKASYLFNYRYSLLGIMGAIIYGKQGGVNEFPVYQDLCFKINLPTSKLGTFSVSAISGIGSLKNEPDTGDVSYEWQLAEEDFQTKMAAVSLTNKYIIGKKTYLQNSLVATGNSIDIQNSMFPMPDNIFLRNDISYFDGKYAFNSLINHKFNAKLSNRTGFIYNYMFYDTDIKGATSYDDDFVQVVKSKGETNLIQAFSQFKYRVTENITANLGSHFQYFTLNDNYSVEPRASLKWNFTDKQSIAFGYGLHGQLENISIYMIENKDENNNIISSNKDLDFTKAHHFVFAYDLLITNNLRLKIEPYYQSLFNVPVIENTYFSTINITEGVINNKLINEGTGTNKGIDFTLERFLDNNFYWLATVSLYDSKYVGGDGIEYNTKYNGNFAINALLGKEFVTKKQNIFGINGKINFSGGERYMPLDEKSSFEAGMSIYDFSKPYSAQLDNFYSFDLTITYRKNKTKYSSIWAIQIKNVLNSMPDTAPYYDRITKNIEYLPVAGILPFISYKIEF